MDTGSTEGTDGDEKCFDLGGGASLDVSLISIRPPTHLVSVLIDSLVMLVIMVLVMHIGQSVHVCTEALPSPLLAESIWKHVAYTKSSQVYQVEMRYADKNYPRQTMRSRNQIRCVKSLDTQSNHLLRQIQDASFTVLRDYRFHTRVS